MSQPKLGVEEEDALLRSLRDNSAIWFENVYGLALSVGKGLLESKGNDFQLQDLGKEELADIKRRMLCQGMGLDDSATLDNTYELFAIIMHRGTAHSGHYFAYIKDYQGEGSWCGPGHLESLHLAAEAKMAGERQVKMYVVDKDGEAVWVKAKTALGVLVAALQTEPGQACNLGKLGTLVKKQTGKNWVNSFKVR